MHIREERISVGYVFEIYKESLGVCFIREGKYFNHCMSYLINL